MKWTDEANSYLKKNRPTQTIKELADYFGTTDISVQRQCERLRITCGRKGRLPGSRNKVQRPKVLPVTPEPKSKNVDDLWQAQSKRNKERLKKYNTVERDFSKYKSVRIDAKTVILVPIESV